MRCLSPVQCFGCRAGRGRRLCERSFAILRDNKKALQTGRRYLFASIYTYGEPPLPPPADLCLASAARASAGQGPGRIVWRKTTRTTTIARHRPWPGSGRLAPSSVRPPNCGSCVRPARARRPSASAWRAARRPARPGTLLRVGVASGRPHRGRGGGQARGGLVGGGTRAGVGVAEGVARARPSRLLGRGAVPKWARCWEAQIGERGTPANKRAGQKCAVAHRFAADRSVADTEV